MSQRPDPEELLRKVMRLEGLEEEPTEATEHGKLKIHLGFAAGVGKTYEMLNEGNRRKARGQDVFIGYVETHGRVATVEQIGDLEIIPRKKVEYRGATFEEMDTEAILSRAPFVALVDELAHTNVPGSERQKRWQDVELLLDAGINVITTMNVQHLESLNDTVYDITGVAVRETVPDSFMRRASEIQLIDLTPQALINRLKRGDVYKPEKVEQALQGFFREGNLAALREIAMREAAREIEEDVGAYRKHVGIRKPWATVERVMVCLSPTVSSLRILRRGWRIAQALQAEVVAVTVQSKPIADSERQILENDFALANRLGIPVVTLNGDEADEIIRFARDRNITQIILGHSARPKWQRTLKGSFSHRLIEQLPEVDIVIMANKRSDPTKPA